VSKKIFKRDLENENNGNAHGNSCSVGYGCGYIFGRAFVMKTQHGAVVKGTDWECAGIVTQDRKDCLIGIGGLLGIP
jgi:hypothetical protein